jgi:hypothetical protein
MAPSFQLSNFLGRSAQQRQCDRKKDSRPGVKMNYDAAKISFEWAEAARIDSDAEEGDF